MGQYSDVGTHGSCVLYAIRLVINNIKTDARAVRPYKMRRI